MVVDDFAEGDSVKPWRDFIRGFRAIRLPDGSKGDFLKDVGYRVGVCQSSPDDGGKPASVRLEDLSPEGGG